MATNSSSQAWRPIFAALGNKDARSVYAQIVLGISPETAGLQFKEERYNKIVQQLLRAGLVCSSQGQIIINEQLLPGILKEAGSVEKAVGPARFLTRTGKIDRYPTDQTERLDLLIFVARQVITATEKLTEPELNARLEPFDPDIARLRRYLVDYCVLARTANGSEYSLLPVPSQ